MFKNCTFWCRWHNYCLNTTNGECKGLKFPEEEQNAAEEKLERTTY